MFKRFFTVKEARKILPLANSIGKDIKNQWGELVKIKVKLKKDKENKELAAEYIERIQRVRDYLQEMDNLNIFVADYVRGVVAFPSMFDQRQVMLCYEVGVDKSIIYYFNNGEGFDRKKVIPERFFVN